MMRLGRIASYGAAIYRAPSWRGSDLTFYGCVRDAAGRIRGKHQFGVRRVGYLRHDLTGSKASHEFVEPDVFVNIDLGNWLRAPQGFITRYGNEPLRGLVFDDWYT